MKTKLLIIFSLFLTSFVWSEEEPKPAVSNIRIDNEDRQEDFAFEDNLATLGGEPSSMIQGCVNAVSGTFIENGYGLVSPGAHPLRVHHLYTSSSGWWITEPEKMRIPSQKHPKVITHSYRGMRTSYTDDEGEKHVYRVRQSNYRNGLTNCSSGYVSGRNNARNTWMTIRAHEIREEKIRATFHDGAGIIKQFETPLIRKNKKDGDRYNSGAALTYEQYPWGLKTQYKYLYGPRGWATQEISNHNAHQALNSIAFNYDYYKVNECLVALGDEGKSGFCKYYFNTDEEDQIKSIIPTAAPPTQYFYEAKTKRLNKIMKPNGRILEIAYYTPDLLDPKSKNKSERVLGRVHSLKAPVGHHHSDKTLYTTHRFIYNFKEDKAKGFYGSTHVFDIQNQETIYHYDTDTRLKGIHECGDTQTNRMRLFYWYGKDSAHDGNLRLQTLQGTLHQILSCRHYLYDANGNVIQDILFGNLTGNNPTSPTVNADGYIIENGCERHQTTFRYSQDGFNHLLEEDDGLKITTYTYFEHTDLLKAKYMIDPTTKHIKYREFYTYDPSGCVTRFVYDDGCELEENNLSGITERHITYTHYRTTFPTGLPQIVEEKYVDLPTRQEISLKKVENHHNAQGLIVKQDHYDALGEYLYSLTWNYNEHGKVLSETDALGYTSYYKYDDNDNLVEEYHAGDVHTTCYEYDNCNRLTLIQDVHPAFSLKQTQAYNLLNEKMWSIDWYGNPTNYEYDRLGRPIKTAYSEILHPDGYLYRPVETSIYDIADNLIAKTDPAGRQIQTTYNLRGQPLSIQYADGGREFNQYSLNGLLIKNTALNGTVTDLFHDYLGRVTQTLVKGPSGEQSLTQNFYNHFHKLQEIDANKGITTYQYDAAGRLKILLKGDSKTVYEYDSCSRVARILDYFGTGEKDYLVKTQTYDLKNHVIEERQEDAQGNILTRVRYTYNPRGERTQTISYHQEIPAVTTYEYNDYGEVEKMTDPEGHVTQTRFHYFHVNAWGQNVAAKEIIDPMGNIRFLECDTLGRLKWEIQKDAFGTTTQKREYVYDVVGNCVEQIEYVIAPGQPEYTVKHAFAYDTNNQLIIWIASAGTPEAKVYRYEYSPSRQKTCVVKSDGTRLEYAYDYLGRLTDFKSSKRDVHYRYTYDANFNVVQVEDLVQKTKTQRTFDANNRLTQEILANDLCMQYLYDGLGRTVKITLPDQSTIDYLYDSHHLSKILRGAYTYSYQKYNLGGLLEKAQMIGQAGPIEYVQDSSRRLINLMTPLWKEEIPSQGFDKVGNLIKKVVTNLYETIVCQFSYDNLYQLQAEEGVETHAFQHDSLYNLLQKDQLTHQINSLSQLLHDGIEPYHYDINGNLIEKGSFKYTYDSLDRLIRVEEHGKLKAEYTYDELNRRISRTIDHTTTRYLYQGQNEIGAVDAKDHLFQLRVLGLGKGAEKGAAVLFEIQGQTYAPIHDILGNVCALIHPENGKLVESYKYTAYGQEVTHENPLSPWRFCSKRTDPETQFVYFGNRYYNPSTARWVTADPLGLKAGPNLYAFVCNNPLRHYDLYGLEIEGSGVWTTICDFGSFICQSMGQIIYTLGHELIPVPLLKDPFQFVGHLLQGNDPSSYVMSYRETHSQYWVKPGGPNAKDNMVMVNGICATIDEVEARGLKQLEETEGKQNVYVCYNATHGLMADLLECVAHIVGIPTHSVEVYKECMYDAHKALGDEGNLFLNAHSQGGLICYDGARTLDKAILARTNAYTLGSPIALSEGTYGDVYNVAASWDFVTWGTRFSNEVKSCIGLKPAPLEIISTRGGILNAHFYDKPTYSKELYRRNKNIRDNR